MEKMSRWGNSCAPCDAWMSLIRYFVERAHFSEGGGLCGLLAECDEVLDTDVLVGASMR